MVYRRESPYLFWLYRIAQFGNGQPSQVMKLRLELLPDRLKVSNKGTIRAVERIAKTILTEDCTCLYVLSVVSAQFRLYIGNRIRDRDQTITICDCLVRLRRRFGQIECG